MPISRIAHAGEPDSTRYVVEFVDSTSKPEVAAELGDQIAAKLREQAEQAVEPSSDDKQIVVYISEMPSAPGEDYLVRAVAIAYAQQVADSEPLACVACGAQELAETAISMFPPLLDALASVEPPVAEPVVPAPVVEDPSDRPPEPAAVDPKPRRLQLAGTITAVLGGAMLGAGAGLLGVGVSYPSEPGGVVYREVDYAVPGVVVGGIGGAMLISGLVCFGLGMRDQNRKIETLAIGPVVLPGLQGASMTWSF